MFHVGQMVVCVDDAAINNSDGAAPSRPAKGRIYTVRGFGTYPPGTGLYLEELLNPTLDFGSYGSHELAFKPERFCPVKDTSIEIFRQLVANPKDKVRA